MKNFLTSKLPFLKSRFEFTTSLSLTTSENRLEGLGASIREADPIGKRRSITFLLEHPQRSFLWQPALSGELQEVEKGTLIRADFHPNRLFSNYILFVVLFFYSLYSKNYGFIFLPIVLTLANTAIVYSHRSSWEYLERKVIKSLLHWKKDKK